MSDLERTIATTLDSLMGALAPLGFVARHIHPGEIDAVLEAVGKPDGGLTVAIEQFRRATWPQQLQAFRTQVEKAADATLEAWGALRLAAAGNDIRRAYRALRSEARAQEALFPLARVIPQVSLFFLDPEAREDAALKADLAQGMGVDREALKAGMTSPEGKERLQKRLTETINRVLTKTEGFGGVDAVHFKSFLVQ